MKYIRYQEIDKRKWDEMVHKSTNPKIYMLSWYQDISCQNWDAVIWGDYQAGIPLFVKSFFFVKYVPPALLVQQTGIIFPIGFDYITALKQFFNSSFYNHCFRFGLSFHSEVDLLSTGVPEKYLVKKRNLFLRLQSSYDDIVKGYNENRKRILRRRQKQHGCVSLLTVLILQLKCIKKIRLLNRKI